MEMSKSDMKTKTHSRLFELLIHRSRIQIIVILVVAVVIAPIGAGSHRRAGKAPDQQWWSAQYNSGYKFKRNADLAEPDSPDKAMEWRHLWWVEEKGSIPANALMTAVRQRQENLSYQRALSEVETAGVGPSSWTSRGPQNVAGRTRSLVIHPNNPSI